MKSDPRKERRFDCTIDSNKEVKEMNRTKIISLVAILVFATSFFSGCSTSNDASIQPVMGNSSGNMNNGGIAARQGEWVYFNTGNAIYKEKTDGSERMLVINAGVSNLNVADEWIFYAGSGDVSKIYKVRTDGTGETLLYETIPGEEYIGSLQVVGDWIYFSAGSSDDQGLTKLYKMKLDGTGKTVISNETALDLNFVGDWIYYANWSDGWKIYRMKTDGTERTELSEEAALRMNVYENWIYYISARDSRIYKLKMDGTGKVKLSEEGASALNVSDGWIYYNDVEDNYRIYKMRLDGTEKIKICDDSTNNINVVDDWIYYIPFDKEFYYYEYGPYGESVFKIRTDGTGRSVTDTALENIKDQEVTLGTFEKYADALIGEFGKTYDCIDQEYGRFSFKIDSIETQKELDGEANAVVVKFEGNRSYALQSIVFFDKEGKGLDKIRRFMVSEDTVAFSGSGFNLMDAGKYLVWSDIDPIKNSGKRIVVFEVPNRDSSSTTSFNANVNINQHAISAGPLHVVGLRKDGTVMAAFAKTDLMLNPGNFDVSQWKDIVSVAAGGDTWGYNLLTAGLKSDGTVVCTDVFGGRESDVVNSWKNIIEVAVGCFHIAGLKSDGTVVATGGGRECDVSGWTDIVDISTGVMYTVGLKADGTVVATGMNDEHQCDVSDWTDVVAVSAGRRHTVGLRGDGTVIAVGENDHQQCEVTSWNEIVAISAGIFRTVGIKKDGTLISTNKEDSLSAWKDLVEISSSASIIGLRQDGAIQQLDFGNPELSDWKDIKVP